MVTASLIDDASWTCFSPLDHFRLPLTLETDDIVNEVTLGEMEEAGEEESEEDEEDREETEDDPDDNIFGSGVNVISLNSLHFDSILSTGRVNEESLQSIDTICLLNKSSFICQLYNLLISKLINNCWEKEEKVNEK